MALALHPDGRRTPPPRHWSWSSARRAFVAAQIRMMPFACGARSCIGGAGCRSTRWVAGLARIRTPQVADLHRRSRSQDFQHGRYRSLDGMRPSSQCLIRVGGPRFSIRLGGWQSEAELGALSSPDWTSMRPPWPSTIVREIERPTPMIRRSPVRRWRSKSPSWPLLL